MSTIRSSALLLLLGGCGGSPSEAVAYRDALHSGDCAPLRDDQLRDDCYIAHLDPSAPDACAPLTTERGRGECHFQLAEKTHDPALCKDAGPFADDCALHLVSQHFVDLATPGSVPGDHEDEVAAVITAGGLHLEDRRPWGAWYRQVLQGQTPLDRSACDVLTNPMHKGICRAAGMGLYHDRLNVARDKHEYPCDGGPLPASLAYAPDPELDAARQHRRPDLCRSTPR